jgi:AcrR family transcriptional regulator
MWKEMAKVTRKDAEDRRKEILDTAITVMAFEGYASVTMRGIAERVDIHLSTLQYYFRTKRELLSAAIDGSIGLYVHKIEEIMSDPTGDPRAHLHEAVSIHMKATNDPLISRLFASLWGMAGHVPEVEQLLRERYERDCESYSVLIQRVNPSLSKNQCDKRAVLLLAQLEGLVLMISPGKARASQAKGIQRELLKLLDLVVTAP